MTETRLWPVLEACPVGIAVFDAHQRLIYANPAASALFGVRADPLGQERCGDLIACRNRHEDPRGCGFSEACSKCRLFESIRAALGLGGAPVAQGDEMLLERDEGLARLWIRFKTSPLRINGQVRAVMAVDDVTAVKATEEALRESELKYRSFFDNSLDALLLTATDGAILEVNPATCRMFGRTAGEIRRLGRDGLVDPADPRLAPGLQRRERNGKFHGAITMVRADQTRFEADVTSTVFTDASGRAKTSMIIRDMTEFQQAARKHRELEDQLHHAQRLESVGRLAGGVAHDFNNLLAVILGYTQMVMAETAPTHPHRELLEEVQQAAQRAKDLTRQLLAFSRKQVLEVEATEANAIVTGFQKLIRRVIGEDVALKLALSPTALPVMADTAQIEQVLMNLAVNARDAMPEGGTLTIETAAVDLDESYSARRPGVAPGRYAMIAVSDTGCGMDPRILESIFEPFFTTKTRDKGTGLGLATSYGIVKQHGGNIWAYSEPGHGSTFKVYLALCGQGASVEAQGPDAAARPSGSATVLVVEDDPIVRRMACRILAGHGYTVIEARDVGDALARASAFEKELDLVLSDVVMPEMKGPDVFARIRSLHPGARVLYMSGYTDGAVSSGGWLEPGAAFIQKPFTISGLLEKVAGLLAEPL